MQPNLIGESPGYRARFAILGAALAATIALFALSSPCEGARSDRSSRIEEQSSPLRYRSHGCRRAVVDQDQLRGMRDAERAVERAERAVRRAERAAHRADEHARRDAARAERDAARAQRDAERAQRDAARMQRDAEHAVIY